MIIRSTTPCLRHSRLVFSITLALGLSLGNLGCGASSPRSSGQQTGTEPAVKSAELHAFTSDEMGFNTHSYWLDTGHEVVVFDAQFTPALADQVIADIRSKSSSPIRYVVVTHPNPDKFNGATAFQKIGAKLVASEMTVSAIPSVHAYKKYYFVNVAKMFTSESYPEAPSVDVSFSKEFTLPLEGQFKVMLRELGYAGVSANQTLAIIPSANALVVGDLVHHHAHAWLEGPLVDGRPRPALGSWKRALTELEGYPGMTVFGGRGSSVSVETAVKEQTGYLDEAARIVESYVSELHDPRAELAGEHAKDHFKQVALRFAKAYPDYEFPYLIEYGVYGLLDQTAR